MKNFCCPLYAFAALFLLSPALSRAQTTLGTAESLSTPHLTVAGRGEAKVRLDKLDVTIGVDTERKSSQAAAANNADTLQRIQNAVRKAGVAAKDVQIIPSSAVPVYTSEPDPNTPGARTLPHITSYHVYSQARITVRELAKMSEALDAIAAVGPHLITAISVDAEDQKAALAEALAKAVQDARRKADTLAKASNTALNGVLAITDNTNHRQLISRTYESVSVPFSPDELTMTAVVTVTYRLSGGLNK